MKLIAFDTSTDACSCALFVNGSVYERFEMAPRQHAQKLLAMVEAALREGGLELGALDALAFGRGPGSFTGIRIATAAVQALAFGADLPVVPVSSLAALAQGAHETHGVTRIAAAFDARMGEVYWGAFEIDSGGIARVSQTERVCRPGDSPLLNDPPWTGVGEGWEVYETSLRARFGSRIDEVYPSMYPRARDVAILAADGFRRGEAVSAEAALPVYLRDRVTRT